MSVEIKWKKLSPQAMIPQVQSAGAACFDLHAVLGAEELLSVEHGKLCVVPTSLSVEIPEGYEMQIRARSGLAFKQGITLVNGVGTIDSDYRGEIKILLSSLISGTSFQIKNGDRIAQALIAPVLPITHVEVQDLTSTERGAGGFGSTGVTAGANL